MTAHIQHEAPINDGIKWYPRVEIEKYDPDQVGHVIRRLNLDREPTLQELRDRLTPEFTRAEGNLLTTAGLTRMTAILNLGTGVLISNTTARIGVGDTNTAANVANTDLAAAAGATHRYFQPMAATYPTVSAGLMTFQSIFGINDGNFSWAEWCIDLAAATVSGGTTVNTYLLNRAVAALGTKVTNAIWTFTATITLS